MKKCFALIALAYAATLPDAMAGEREMQQALELWKQQEAEYQAALSIARTEEQRASLPPPSADETAAALWKAVRTQTGMREETLPTPRRAGQKSTQPQTRKSPVYEFDEEWAAPAVVWFIQRPEAFAKLFSRQPNRLSGYAEALLESINRKHFSSPLIADACPKLAENSSATVYDILEKIYQRNESPAARGNAALAMSIMLANPVLAGAEGGYARARSKRLYYIKQALNLAPGDAMFGEVSLTQAAEEQIYRLRHLSIGSIPQQFTVTGQDGKEATFPVQGKPNLLFFWSPAEDVGFSIMCKQQALMRQFPELVLCPIVVHGDADEWREMLRQNHIPICYMDDENGTTGINYRVEQLPLAVLVSDTSRILYIGYPNMELQTALDTYFKTYAPKSDAPPASPAPQPQTPPAAVDHDAPPALREMPAF